MMPTAVGRRPLDGSMPRTTCTSGNPKTFSRDRYSKLDGRFRPPPQARPRLSAPNQPAQP